MPGLKKITLLLLVSVACTHAFCYIIVGAWEPIFKGVDKATGRTDAPRLQEVRAIRIDLQDPDIRLITTHSNGAATGDTTRQKGFAFMAEYGVQIGINGQYINLATGSPYADLYGLSISQGQIVSPAENLNALLGVNPGTLLVTADNQAHVQITLPATNLTGVWTAIESWAYLLVNGVNTGDPRYIAGNIEPRSAVGLSQNRRYLILLTIDGRQTGYSEGATSYEESQWLQRFGAYNGINLDGGGSTHLWLAEYGGSIYAFNSPSEDRSVPNHLGIYAAPLNPYYEARDDVYVYANFENLSEAWFDLSPGYSGSTYGINKALSTATAVASQSFQGTGSQMLYIVDDTTASGGWFVRHLSGTGTRSENMPRETNGYIGFWAKTTAAGCQVSIAIDNTNNVTADRGDWKNLINDGQWHLYEWRLDNNNDWHAWASGDGIIDTVDFTIDSIQIQCSLDAGAVIYIDAVAHSSRKGLVYLFETLGDFEPDGDVDLEDFAALAANWLLNSGNGNWDPLYDLYYPYDDVIGLDDLAVFGSNWLK